MEAVSFVREVISEYRWPLLPPHSSLSLHMRILRLFSQFTTLFWYKSSTLQNPPAFCSTNVTEKDHCKLLKCSVSPDPSFFLSFLTIRDIPFQSEKLSMYKFILCLRGTFVTEWMPSFTNDTSRWVCKTKKGAPVTWLKTGVCDSGQPQFEFGNEEAARIVNWLGEFGL